VKIRGGDVWSARALAADARYEEGTDVFVHEVRGVAVLVDTTEPPEPASEATVE
jgi:membrane protein implicated in regulation of membrane protease activity